MERALTAPAEKQKPLLVAVVGPTGSGKTALSVSLAQHFNGEIVNCDSVAMYREFEIGTAKPTSTERARVLHHLLDFVDPTGYITAGDYARLAKRSEDLRERLRQHAQTKTPAYLHRLLSRLDPHAIERIHPNDTPKLIRAIEVCLQSRQKMTDIWEQGRDPLTGFRILRLGLNPERQALYEHINARAKRMFDCGLVEETQRLLAKYGSAAAPLSSLGYKQAVQLLRGEIDLEQAISAAQQAHRNYAKRQITWFGREPDVIWLTGFGGDPAIQNVGMTQVQKELSKN